MIRKPGVVVAFNHPSPSKLKKKSARVVNLESSPLGQDKGMVIGKASSSNREVSLAAKAMWVEDVLHHEQTNDLWLYSLPKEY